jgi:hypothetical protein
MSESTPCDNNNNNNKKRRRSSKKLPTIDGGVDPSLLDLDWAEVARLVRRINQNSTAPASACTTSASGKKRQCRQKSS